MKLFSKNNIIYISLIAVGFFWCGSTYLSQEADLTRILGDRSNLVNGIAIGVGSLAMAAGILLFAVFYKHKMNIRKLFLAFLAVCAALNIWFWLTENVVIKSAVLILTCAIGTAGYGGAYHFALLGSRVKKDQIGRCFAIGYAIGAIGTYLLTIVPKIDLFSSSYSLIVYIPAIAANFLLIRKYGDIHCSGEETRRVIPVSAIIALSVMVAIMALLSNYAFGLLDYLMKGQLHNVVFNRAFYALGLIAAGIIADKNKKFLEFTTIFSLLFSLVICVFLQEGISASVMQLFAYVLLGFFVVFRTVFFIDLGQQNSKYIMLAGTGLAISSVIEGLFTFVVTFFMKNYLILIVALVFVFMLLFVYYYFRYDKEMANIRYEKLSEKKSKEERILDFCAQYDLTRREEEVLRGLLQKKSGKEIADELAISTGTVKNISSKIYKKTLLTKEDILKRLNG